jgi:hypothetical protein
MSDIPLEGRHDEQEQPAVAEGHETEVLPPQRGEGEGGKKPFIATKAIRLTTISKLLEKHTIHMNKIGQLVQSQQKQLKSVEKQTNIVKQLPSQIKQLQQVQKDSQRIRLLLSKKETSSTQRKNPKRRRKR